MQKKKVNKKILIPILIIVVMIGGILVGPFMSNVEQPNYQVLRKDETIEIRSYIPMIVAEVHVEGERTEAIKKGFRILADYIFGSNKVNKKMVMTAPVQQETSQKIDMTAPVQQEGKLMDWKVKFVMPSEFNLQTLPKPNNKAIVLSKIPEKRFIVIRFSGRNNDKNIKEHKDKLLNYIKEHNINIKLIPTYAFYNPPWTLPILRRNEIMFEILVK